MRKVKIITITLLIVLITLISFFGIYLPKQNRMENIIKEYNFSRDIEGGRVIELQVATGETKEETDEEKTDVKKVNPEDLTPENFKIVKATLEQRLDDLQAQDYIVSLDEQNGNIIVELAEDVNVDTYIYYLTASRKVVLKEEETDNEFITDEMVKGATYTYTSDRDGKYKVTVGLELTKDGQVKLEEVTKNYAVLASEVEEIEEQREAEEKKKEEKEKEDASKETEKVEESNEQTTTKKIAKLTIGGNEYDIEKIEGNLVTITMGTPTANTSYVNSYISQAAEICMLIGAGQLPIDYELYNNRYVYSENSINYIMYFGLAALVVLALILIVLIIKYRTRGLLVGISFIGFISLFLLVLRYANVIISIEGILSILVIIVINLVINIKILNRVKIMHLVKEAVKGVYKDMFFKLIPIMILTITFCFAKWYNLSSFGMIMFWGLALIALYNLFVTKTLLELKDNK